VKSGGFFLPKGRYRECGVWLSLTGVSDVFIIILVLSFFGGIIVTKERKYITTPMRDRDKLLSLPHGL
jgi:hypothetical protein